MRSAFVALVVLSVGLSAVAGIVPDFDYKLTPWKTRADEWRSSPCQTTSVTNWTGYERLAFDIVSYDIGGEQLNVFLKGAKHQSGLVNIRVPCLTARTYEITLERFQKAGVDLANVTGISFSARWAQAFDVRIMNVRILKAGEKAEDAKPDATVLARLKERRAAWKAGRAQVHTSAFKRWREACVRAQTVSGGAVFGKASSMLMVRPRDDFEAEPATDLGLRLARNEKESLQLLIAPDGADLESVRVEVSDLKAERSWYQLVAAPVFVASNIVVAPMGYVALKRVPEHSARVVDDPTAPGRERRIRHVPGWFPDPILDFLGSVDAIRGDDVQSFWIKARCPSDQPAGVYRGTIRATWTVGGRMKVWTAPFTVRINDFTIGTVSPIPLSMSYQPSFSCANYERLGRSVGTDWYKVEQWIHAHTNCAPYLARKRVGDWADFLADNLITIDFLYPSVAPRWDELLKLKIRGQLGAFNLKYWNDGSNHDDWFADARKRYEKAKELGLLDYACFYGADELPKELFPKIEAMAARLKREFPKVKIVTTLKDNTYSLGSCLKSIDVFVPVTGNFIYTNAVAARAAGKEVGWYVCGGGESPRPEFFFGRDAIEPRLLTSAAAAKFNPQWFLYYAMASWSTIEPITAGPFTKWSPEGWHDYVGDGNILACGPGGRPLSTMRLENFRDGLEDYAYAVIYRERYGTGVEVPDELVKDLNHYTRDPKVLQAWRDRMADLIEAKKGF
mgnify:CR=1 FL=1